jgi:hypothetical protein
VGGRTDGRNTRFPRLKATAPRHELSHSILRCAKARETDLLSFPTLPCSTRHFHWRCTCFWTVQNCVSFVRRSVLRRVIYETSLTSHRCNVQPLLVCVHLVLPTVRTVSVSGRFLTPAYTADPSADHALSTVWSYCTRSVYRDDASF